MSSLYVPHSSVQPFSDPNVDVYFQSLMLLGYFYLLGGTAERFFCPALARISEGLKMSPNVAGVTLLALGNGSPDIFSTIAAVSQGSFASSLGSQLGAGMFVTTVVAGAVAVAAGKVQTTVTRRPFLRDVAFYVLALIMVFIVCWDKKIHLWQSLGFIGIYLVYVVVVILGRFIYQRHKRRKLDGIKHDQAMNTADIVDIGPGSVDTSELFSDGDELDALDEELLYANAAIPMQESDAYGDEETHLTGSSALAATSQLAQRNRKISRRMRKMVYLSKIGLWGDKQLEHAATGKRPQDRKPHDFPSAWNDPAGETGASHIDSPPRRSCTSVLNSHWDDLLDFFDWPSMSRAERIFFIFTLPRYIAQHTTIPWAEEGKYFRWFTVAHPLSIFIGCSSAFQLWGKQTAAGPLWVWLLGVAIVLTLVLLFTTNNDAPPRYEPLLIVAGMVMAIVWIYFIANELVSLLQSVGIIIGISNGILGITVLAWGNSVGDMIANVVVAKSGQPQMAISACFAAPMTNMMMGLGVATSIRIFQQGLTPYLIDNDDLHNNLFIAFIFLAACQILTVIVVPLSKFRFTRQYGLVQIVLYIAFTVLSILAEIKLILPNTEVWHDWGSIVAAPFSSPGIT